MSDPKIKKKKYLDLINKMTNGSLFSKVNAALKPFKSVSIDFIFLDLIIH